MYQLYRDRPFMVLCIVFANVLLSLWCISADPIVNNDAVTYLSIAQQFVGGHWAQAFEYYSWPFYSVFIAALAKLLFVDVETAAYILNTLFATSLTLAFVCVVGQLSGNNRRIIFIAAIIILLFPSINKYRSFIIRDFGYLSCYLWSLYFIFRFCTTLNKRHLIGWLAFAAASCLFRFEGIVFVLIAPYFLFLFVATKVPHRRTILTLLSTTIVVSCIALLFWYVNDKYNAMIAIAKITGEDINGVTDLFFANIQQRLGDQTLTPLRYIGVFATNVGDVIYELVRRMAVLYLIFVIYAYCKQGLVLNETLERRIWVVYVIANLLVLIGFSLYNNFLVSRYTMATALTLLLIAPFAIDHLLLKVRKAGLRDKVIAALVAIILAGVSIEQKMYLKDAGKWLAKNIPADATVYSNNKLIVYYANRSIEANLKIPYDFNLLIRLLVSGQIRNYDYVALATDNQAHSYDAARQTLSYHLGAPIITFQENETSMVFIFKRKQL